MAKKKCDDLHRCEVKSKQHKLHLAIPIVPSVNHMYINTKRGGKKLSKKAEDYVRKSRAMINLYVERQNWKRLSNGFWCYVDIYVYMPDKRIRDSHNMIKLLMDVMQGIVFENDYYACPRIQSVEFDKDNPRVEVVVTHQTDSERKKHLKAISA